MSFSVCNSVNSGIEETRSSAPPHAIKNYNCEMESVELVDKSILEFRPMIRWKKFISWYSLIVNAFGLLRVATSRLYELSDLRRLSVKLSWTPRMTWLSIYLENFFLNHILFQPQSPYSVVVIINLFIEHVQVSQGKCCLYQKNARLLNETCQAPHLHYSPVYHQRL